MFAPDGGEIDFGGNWGGISIASIRDGLIDWINISLQNLWQVNQKQFYIPYIPGLNIPTGTDLKFPVGDGNDRRDIIIEPVPGVPGVVSVTGASPPTTLPVQVAPVHSPPNQSVLPVPDQTFRPDESGSASVVVQAADWFEYWNIINGGGQAMPPIGGGTVGAGPNLINQEDEDVSLIYDVIDVAIGGWLPGGPVSPWGANTPPPNQFSDVVLTGNAGGDGGGSLPPVVTTGGGSCGPGGGAQPVYKKVCGVYKWVTPKRRRRRALATKGNLKDLAALKGILGTGKAFETWIATHS